MKRQRSEPTTPIYTFSRPPHEYDEVMRITQVEPRDAERFEEGIDSEFQDAEKVKTAEGERRSWKHLLLWTTVLLWLKGKIHRLGITVRRGHAMDCRH